MNKTDAMRRYHAEIMRNLDATERLCESFNDEDACNKLPCPFHGERICRLRYLRAVLGHQSPLPPGAEALPPIGTCDNGVVVGKEILCKFSGLCRYQSNRVSTSTSPYLNGQPGIYAVCTREAAALALAEQPVNADELPDEMAGRCK